MNIKETGKLLLRKIKTYNKERKVTKYYIDETRKDKSYLATLIDGVIFRTILTFVFFIYFFIWLNNFLVSGLLTTQFYILLHLILRKIKKLRFKKIKEDVNAKLIKEKVYKDLMNKNPYEFIQYMILALEKCKFNDLKLLKQEGIDLVGILNGKPIGIKLFQYNEDYKVDSDQIRAFFLVLKEMNIQEAMAITTSTYSEDVKELMAKLEGHINLNLVDLNGITKLFKTAELCPTDKDIKNIVLNKVADNKRKIETYRREVLSKGKITKYIIISVLIFFAGKVTPYPSYYTIMSLILFLLAVITGAKYLIDILRSQVEKQEENII